MRYFSGRPDFMTWTFAGAFVLASASGLLAETVMRKEAAAGMRTDRSEASLAEELERRGWIRIGSNAATEHLSATRGVEVLAATRAFELGLHTGIVSGKRSDRAELQGAAAVVAQELSRYPRSFLESIHLKRVLLCSALRERAEDIPSLPNYERTLLLDTAASGAFLRRILHHEVFHFADFAEDEQVLRDPQWEKLNDRYFVYGNGGRYTRESDTSRFRDDLPGFLSAYSTSGLEEDKAEIFAFLMVSPLQVAAVAERDPVVATKVRRLLGVLARRFPTLDDRFWAAQGLSDSR